MQGFFVTQAPPPDTYNEEKTPFADSVFGNTAFSTLGSRIREVFNSDFSSFEEFQDAFQKVFSDLEPLPSLLKSVSKENFAIAVSTFINGMQKIAEKTNLPLSLDQPIQEVTPFYHPFNRNTVPNEHFFLREFLSNENNDFISIEHRPNASYLTFHIQRNDRSLTYSVPNSDSFTQQMQTNGVEEIHNTQIQLLKISNACNECYKHLDNVLLLYQNQQIPPED